MGTDKKRIREEIMVPYLSKTITAISFDDNLLRILTCRRTLNKTDILVKEQVELHDENLCEAVQEHVKLRNDSLYMLLLPDSLVETMVIDVHEQLDEDELDDWIHDHWVAGITENPEIYQYRYMQLNEEKFLVAFIEKTIIKQHTELFKRIGIDLFFIGASSLTIGSVLAEDEKLKSKHICISKAIGEDMSLYSVFHESKLIDFAVEDNQTRITDFMHVDEQIKSDNLKDLEISGVTGDFFSNYGAILEYYNTKSVSLNFAEDKDKAFVSIARFNTTKLLMLLVFAFAVVYGIPGISNLLLSNTLSSQSEQLAVLKDKTSLLKKEEKAIEEMNNVFRQTNKLSNKKSEMAAYLEVIGKHLPADTWLTDLDIENTDNNTIVTVEGYSFANTKVSAYLQNLEKTEIFSSVKFQKMEHITKDFPVEVSNASSMYIFTIELKRGEK